MKKYIITTMLITLLGLTSVTFSKNIDLSTVPSRQTVQLTIYNAEDLTLVRESRFITFKEGINPLQFSWAGTLIDPTSVEIRFLTRPDELSVLDTTFPHDKPQMLYWNIRSEFSGEARVEISYFTSGITWSADYVGVVEPDERFMHLEGFVTVINNSGEDYEDAQVRLVVGTVNLVEKIADLARRGIISDDRKSGRYIPPAAAKMKVMREAVMEGEMAAGLDFAADEMMPQEKQIVKEGLSEYFIFTIEGKETVPDKWSKRMRSFEAAEVPVKVQYRYRQREYGDRLVRMLLLTNDEDSDLGQSPLPDGMVRVFRQTGRDSLSFLAGQEIKYIPIGDKIELNMGEDPEVVFELIKLYVFRDNIWMKFHGADVLHRADEAGLRLDPRSQVVGWDEHTVFTQRIRNYSGKPIDLEIRRTITGDIIFLSKLGAELYDYRTIQYTDTIKSGQTIDLKYEVVSKQGRNSEQSRIVLVGKKPTEVPWLE